MVAGTQSFPANQNQKQKQKQKQKQNGHQM
jgi:hypothetical protein